MRYIIKLLISLTLFSAAACPVLAVAVAPSVIEVEVDPGEITSTNVLILNPGNQDVMVIPNVGRWRGVTPTEDSLEWIQFPTDSVIIESEGRADRKLVIQAPEDFVGEKRAYLLFRELQRNSMFSTQLGVPVYMMSSSHKRIEPAITGFTASYNVQENKLSVLLIMNNTGNVHVRPEVTMKLMHKETGVYLADKEGNAEFVIAQDWPLFPNEPREFEKTLEHISLPHTGTYVVELDAEYKYLFKVIASQDRCFEVTLK